MSTINVTLGSVNKSEFKGSIPSTAPSKAFTISLYCSAPTDVRIGFFGLEADPSVPDTLALTQDAGAVSGIGIKLSDGSNDTAVPEAGTAAKLNEASNQHVLRNLKTSCTTNAERINLTAQYIQTGDTINVGMANSHDYLYANI
ncbi:fimbrial protein [Klebsiella aerogenes]